MMLTQRVTPRHIGAIGHRALELASAVKSFGRRLWPPNLRETIAANTRFDRVVAYYCAGLPNWGDMLNPVLIQRLSGMRVVPRDRVFVAPGTPVHVVVGSTLGMVRGGNVVVWGAGFISADTRLRASLRAVHAVRGPLTRARLREQGVACPDVYGDPALLLPRLYSPPVQKRYALGIVPHYVDAANPWVQRFRHDPEIRVIDVFSGTFDFIDEILRCERVASSSLHGVIAAEAYGVPAVWVEFSRRVEGNGFKFQDYFASMGRHVEAPLRISPTVTPKHLIATAVQHDVALDLGRLISTCPFV